MGRRNSITALLALGAICFGALDAVAGEARQPKEHTIRIVSDLDSFRMYFEPRNLRIEPGDKVTWVNEEAIDHNVMTYPDGFPEGAAGFESPNLSEAGQSFSVVLEHTGTYQYHCLPHLIMGMHGSIQVGDPAAETSFHVPSADEVRAYRDKLLEYFDQDDIDAMPRAKEALNDEGQSSHLATTTPVRHTHHGHHTHQGHHTH